MKDDSGPGCSHLTALRSCVPTSPAASALNQLFGFLNIYKPKGITSHDVISRLRRITNIKQIGHTGTLDPFAEGVLPICIGKATRLIEFFDDDKEYLATVQFGNATTTYDLEGDVTFSGNKKIKANDITLELKKFEGEISQIPPIYSAIKVNGKKLYDYARKGEEIEIQPRNVTVYKIELKNFDKKTQQAEILISCSKGTYIRSIAHDLGQNLGAGGHLIKLIRTKSGKFQVENSIELDKLDEITKIEHALINPIEILDYPKVYVNEEELEKIKHGQFLLNKNIKDGDLVILIYNNENSTHKKKISAVGVADKNKILIKKVFV